MIKHWQLQGALALIALGAVGCGADFDTATGEDSLDGVETTQQEIWKASWTGRAGDEVMSIARTASGRPYAWYKSGWVCYGNEAFPSGENLCAVKQQEFVPSQGHSPKDIRATAIKKDNSHVVTWWVDGTYSSGTSISLAAYSGTNVLFTPATKPGGGRFTMDQLLDADHNGADGKYYYYWSVAGCAPGLDPGCPQTSIYRTIGTVDRADAYSPATKVTIMNPNPHGGLRGFAIHNLTLIPNVSMAAWFVTYWNDGFVNISTSSLDFQQP